jgi:adenine-specific DNA methylase
MTERLIEKWLPIAELGIESVRERTPMTPFPAPNRLHVWWARRPLVASRAAVLASLLPADADRERFQHVLGIHGDPVATRRRIDRAKRTGQRFEGDAYGYKRAFLYRPDDQENAWVRQWCESEGHAPTVLDPTSGGGSIPFEAARLGFNVQSNDLNPVAVLVQRATVEFPLVHGQALEPAFRALAERFVLLREERLKSFFPPEPTPDCIPTNYLWARTITCPYCEGLIPLSPNWRLAPDGTGVRLHPDVASRVCRFEIGTSARDQSEGTVSGGDAKCPYPSCGRVVDGDVVKEQAQAGRMGDQLYAVVFKRRVESRTKTGRKRIKWVRGYRAPRPEDDNLCEVAARLSAKLPEWEARDIVPTEEFPANTNDDRPRQYGMPLWRDMFSPRQLLCHGTSVEIYRELLEEHTRDGRLSDIDKAAFGYLALSLDTTLNYGSRSCRWDVVTSRGRSIFDRHDFAFVASYAEMAPLIAGLGYDWAIEKTAKCIDELIELIHGTSEGGSGPQCGLFAQDPGRASGTVAITCGPADSLPHISDVSVDAVVMDPPYYDNVMYAELSGFFYVWLKRTAGCVYPELFTRQLPDTDSEAVANPAKFKGQRGAKVLAGRDYQQKMAAIFAECRRVLKPDGILTLMFTHKATGAWDALATGLMDAGFTITASWPINTEAEGSLHIKDKSAANSTIFLICRPRASRRDQDDPIYWEDVEPRVATAVRARIGEFQTAGLRGVDLYLSCFGPALEEFARHWPLRRGQPRPTVRPRRGQDNLLPDPIDPYAVTPEDALDAARREVKRWRMEQLLRVARQAELDKLTEWFVLAWDAFEAPVFPYDEALRLARVVGLDLDTEVVGHLAEKKGSDLVMWDSARRGAKGAIGPADGSRAVVDALHHVAWRIRQANLQAGRELVEREQLATDPAFLAGLTAVLEVLPMSAAFTHIDLDPGPLAEAASDFEALENLRRLMFADRVREPQQLGLLAEDDG